jgi:preprotein translocase subunit SecD
MKIIQNVTVGPPIGQCPINKGLVAGAVGVTLAVVFKVILHPL